ncbi:MAG: NUDIX hydrolase [Lachnospiraceae bacterium]|nr:NUDIX hydrolase [Lachnospiraceae bacterium]
MSKVLNVKKETENTHLNFYAMEAEDRKGQTFPYYMASRAKKMEDLKMNTRNQQPDGVAVYSLYGEKKDRVVLVRQYRYTLNDYIYEFPAGLVEPGEDYHQAAIREMQEETGLKLQVRPADKMYERAYYTTIGMTDECCALVFGQTTGTVSRKGLEDTEELEVVLADREEVRRILKEERAAVMCAYMLMHFLHDTEDPFDFLKG